MLFFFEKSTCIIREKTLQRIILLQIKASTKIKKYKK